MAILFTTEMEFKINDDIYFYGADIKPLYNRNIYLNKIFKGKIKNILRLNNIENFSDKYFYYIEFEFNNLVYEFSVIMNDCNKHEIYIFKTKKECIKDVIKKIKK